ncbi:L10-interacting MYB domain-containing protein isoform X2 [Oryza sativa Japonica Group]|nr:L10-interacting MYB domain-containing protein isoform X2 [Oryza sativa Japonica Group]ABA96137.1 transposon protein, putative, CACTA, En/Spm sub-class, expressed [Oryza sativa Japonica Group]KAF2913213.1 hypothetical protein DAI22_10g165824 [Oryza sativa Japonica Group]KAF2913214.1 hypothetical protein DAI22_10g165824 [Oryza sativa Japonica Group]BAF29405.1 Os12g0207200 [Oryza sativa Japonica Group]BAG89527.1 unnamed protein product [Oryza sativa Japonica Group]|eukprot:NP_001066386.1 Os12g0207200 [Oryza sativa Japonica Group]
MTEAAEWNDENTKIICELYAEQVRAGNRPSTHLNSIGYSQVALKFQQRTHLLYTKRQLKNKWDKLRNEYTIWKKLLIRGSGLGWDSTKGTIAADENWWNKTNTELPGAKKFRKAGMKNLDHLRVMFDDIASNGVDHTPVPATSSPSTLESPVNVANLDGLDNDMEDNDDTQLEEESPLNRNKKRPRHANNANKNKSSRTEIALLMQAQLKGMADLAEKAQATFENFTSLVGSLGSSIQYVMTLVQECGARSGSDEHFIATELFVSREQREMFLTLSTAEERLEWLRRKYKAKYGA